MIKVEHLKKTYDKNTRHANRVLHDLSFTLPDTGFVCIVGASGCGKTSLLNAIGGLDVFDSGEILTDTARITRASSPEMERERNASFGYIFQNYYLLAEHSVAYNVYLGLHSMPLSKREKAARVKDALRRVDMLRYRKRPVGELSGGQQQRVAIARAIARRPRVIFADEPTGNLDEANTINICSILKKLSRESLIVMVTHEERIARFFADRIITLDEGRILSDTTAWERGTIDAEEKGKIYTGDYAKEESLLSNASLRVFYAEDAAPVELTVVAEVDRIVIKVNDPRIVLCSETNTAPLLEEGKRPVLHADSFLQECATKVPQDLPPADEGAKKSRRGLPPGMLLRESLSLISTKRLRRFGTGVFIILLSFLLAFTVADVITMAHIDPEDFITIDSHMLSFRFERGPGAYDKYESLTPYIASVREILEATEAEINYIPTGGSVLQYQDSTVPQFGALSLIFGYYSKVHISHLDKTTILHGRMAERSDEIVLDRWVIDKMLAEDGILQNLIPNGEYFLGKTITSPRKTYTLKIVGICDSGEPAMYMSPEAMLAFATCGTEVITLSEYTRLTGDARVFPLAPDECIGLTNTAKGIGVSTSVGTYVGSNYDLKLKGYFPCEDASIGAKLIIADEALEPLYQSMIEANGDFDLWCADKEEVLRALEENVPEGLRGMLTIDVKDSYTQDYARYEAETSIKLDTRTIVTFTLLIAGAVMLYLMQRSKIRERMDLVAVYRLLGIPKRNLVFIFATESFLLSLKYALPTVLGVWVLIQSISTIGFFHEISFLYPLWAAGLTFVAIALYCLLVAALPILRLLAHPPARLAAKYDF